MSKELEDLRGLIDECEGCDMSATARRLRPILARLKAAERVARAAWEYHALQPEQSVRAMKGRGNVLDEAIRAYRDLDAPKQEKV